MAFYNAFYGNTTTLSGATFLENKAVVQIEEGYQIGASVHYVNLGDFEVQRQTNRGVFDQQITLDLYSQSLRPKYNYSFFPRKFPSTAYVYDIYNDSNFLSANYDVNIGFWGITNNALRSVHTDPNSDSYITRSLERPLENFRLITKFRVGHAGAIPEVFFRRNNSSSNQYRTYLQNNSMRFELSTDAGSTVLSNQSIGASIVINTDYWLMVEAINSRFNVSLSLNGIDYTTYISLDNNRWLGGAVGFGSYSGVTANIDFYLADLVEFGSHQSKESMIKSSYALSRVFDVNIPTRFSGVFAFEKSTGSSWVTGSSSNVFIVNTGSGSSWHTYFTNGISFNNFVFECEMKGSSNNAVGLACGNTGNFYGGYVWIRPINNAAGSLHVTSDGQSVFFYSTSGIHVFQDNRYYKLKLVKDNTFIGFYVNGLLTTAIYGASLANPALQTAINAVKVGLISYRAASTGSTVEFRNLRISELDQWVDDAFTESNIPISSNTDRYIPEGYEAIWSQDHVEVVKIGSSRGSHLMGPSYYLLQSSKYEDKNGLINISSVAGLNSIGYEYKFSDSDVRSIDSFRSDTYNDPSIRNNTDAQNLAIAAFEQTKKDISEIPLQIIARPHLEKFDKVTLVDTNLGISKTLTVYNQVKTFDMNGYFKQNVTLS